MKWPQNVLRHFGLEVSVGGGRGFHCAQGWREAAAAVFRVFLSFLGGDPAVEQDLRPRRRLRCRPPGGLGQRRHQPQAHQRQAGGGLGTPSPPFLDVVGESRIVVPGLKEHGRGEAHDAAADLVVAGAVVPEERLHDGVDADAAGRAAGRDDWWGAEGILDWVANDKQQTAVASRVSSAYYSQEFVTYLSRFLLNFDGSCAAWWAAQAATVPPSYGERRRFEALAAAFESFSSSVEYGLRRYPGESGRAALLRSLASQHGDDPEKRRHLALAFTLLGGDRQPVEGIRALVAFAPKRTSKSRWPAGFAPMVGNRQLGAPSACARSRRAFSASEKGCQFPAPSLWKKAIVGLLPTQMADGAGTAPAAMPPGLAGNI